MAKEQDTLGLQYLIIEPYSINRVKYFINGNTKEKYGMYKDDMYSFIAKFIKNTDALDVAQKCLQDYLPFAVDINTQTIVQLQFDLENEKKLLRENIIFPLTETVERDIMKDKIESSHIKSDTNWFKFKVPTIDNILQKVLGIDSDKNKKPKGYKR